MENRGAMKVFVKTLGCAKNLVEAETIAGNLVAEGHELTTDIKSADAAVIHTCSFIDAARRESLAAIKSVVAHRQHFKNVHKRIIVSGCLAQHSFIGGGLTSAAQKVVQQADFIVGTGRLSKIPSILKDVSLAPTSRPLRVGHPLKPGGLLDTRNRIVSSNSPWAYLRIAEGCDNRCNYCLIPSLRGNYKSRKMQDIIEEAERLAAAGIKELNLISQDTAAYGKDLTDGVNIVTLLRELQRIKEIKWIRLLYCHPKSITDELIDTIASSQKVVHYLDMPLEHISDKVLLRMGRKITQQELRTLIDKLYKKIPALALRTTFIVGHPGEGKKEFDELCDFVREGHFLWIGIFKYSKQKNTNSAKQAMQVSEREKERRYKNLERIYYEVNRKKIKDYLRKPFEVLVESDGRARGFFSAPEVDGYVELTV